MAKAKTSHVLSRPSRCGDSAVRRPLTQLGEGVAKRLAMGMLMVGKLLPKPLARIDGS